MRFIDIGNTAFVKRKNIFSTVVASDVPIQIQKYRLASIVPQESNNEWPEETVDFIYGKLVDAFVTVAVNKLDEVSECSIRLKVNKSETDIEKLAVDQKLAKFRQPDDDWPPKTKTCTIDHRNGFEDTARLRIKRESNFLEMEKMTAACLKPAEADMTVEQTKKYLTRFGQEFEVATSQRYPRTIAPIQLDFETVSQQLKPRSHRGTRPYKTIKQFDLLGSCITKFKCTFVTAFEPSKVYLKPDIPELNREIEKLVTALDTIDESFLVKMNRPEKHLQKLCLVKNDNCWHRGTINKTSDDENLINVFLVDSANYENFNRNEIYVTPVKIISYPTKIIKIELVGIKQNSNYSEGDIVQHLKNSLKYEELEAIVQGFDEKECPQIKLFTTSGSLSYQNLIDKNIFLES